MDADDVPGASERAAMPPVPAPAEDDGMQGDWSSWDLGSARRALFRNSEAVARRVLRRVHLRWFHANMQATKRMLTAAGVPPKVV